MSLELAAQHLASRGRKGDSMLVHMAPEEVSGLQALAKAAGGTLTLNPDTGLPEANFLKRMLPMIIGAALTPLTGGLINPMTAGLLIGGVETARTGDLGKGLTAGLGAYGGAGLGAGLMGAGAGAAGAAAPAMSMAPAAASPATTGLASSLSAGAAAPAMSMAPAVASPAATGLASSMAPATGTFSAGIKALGTEAGRSAAMSAMGGGAQAAKYGLAALSPTLQADAAAPFAGSGPNPYEFEFDPNNQTYTRVPVGTRQRDVLAPTTRMAADGGMMASGPLEALSNRNQYETMMANGGQRFAAGGQVNLQGTFTAGDQGGGGQFGQANANGYQAAGSGGPLQGFSSSFGQMGGGQMGGFDPRAVQANPQGFAQHMAQMGQREQQMPGSTMMGRPQGGRSYEQFDANQNRMGGGPIEQMVGDMRYRPERDDARIAANQANSSFASYAAGGIASMAQGGPSHLGDYSDGGRLLKGPGNGTSDDIPATIADKRPARLADGEFVIPSRIVSELGNGSTEAGARQLYAMMDRVQKARAKTTGKNKVAFDAKARNLLPA